MEAYFRFTASGAELELKGGEEFIKGLLGDKIQELIHDFMKQGISRLEVTVEEPSGPAEESPLPDKENILPTIAELRAKSRVSNNKELVTLAIYYTDYCQKNSPTNEDLRRILREDLREKDSIVGSLTTYLQRAKKEGWIAQEGKKWRITSTGLKMVQQWLGES